jgi:hypothetical protein
MNKFAVLIVLVILILAVAPAAAEPVGPPDTLYGQYLFANATEAFVKCGVELRLNDSIVALDLGGLVSAKPPIWSFSHGDSMVSYSMGDTVTILRYTLPRRALDATALTNRALWDPVAVGNEVPYAGMGLVHRWLFKLTPEGEIRSDLAQEWYWQGHDLFVILDSTQTFGDNTPIDAYHVKSSLERYLWYHRDTSSFAWQSRIAGVDNYRRGQVNHVVGLIPRHRDTLQISMFRPDFELPSRLAAPRTAIVKWSRTESAAPVVATAGHYSVRVGRTLKGRAPHRGSILVDERATSGFRVREMGHPEEMGPSCEDAPIPAPDLAVLRFADLLDASTKTFLDHGLDRNAIRGLGYYNIHYDGTAFPVCDTANVNRITWRFDLETAKKARAQVPEKRVLQIHWQAGLKDIGEYLVTFLRAWKLEAEYQPHPDSADVSLERWLFESYADDAVVETLLEHLHLEPGDPLIKQFTLARAIGDPEIRTTAYRSIKSRIEDRRPFVRLFQQDESFSHCFSAPIEFDIDYLYRPVGPLFTRRARP